MNIVLVLILVVILVGFSAICSGLNVAVMSLDPADLERKAKLNNKDALIVLPLRKQTHLTLAAILIINIAAVSATSLVLSERFNGWVAGAVATFLIVIFGEVMPQAIFTRMPLRYSARFGKLLKLMVIISYPVSKPLALLLDKLFPRTKAQIQSRHELGLLITEHLLDKRSELDDDEVAIIKGALQLSEKRVKSIMTPIKKTYWLTPDTLLDDPKIDEVKARGFSRIPVFNNALDTCYGLLIMKNLVDVDFDDNHYKVSDLPLHPSEAVGSMTALDTLFRIFIAKKTHLLPIERDDKIIGIVTIEDLIEEIIGHEIIDESDQE